MYTKYSGIPYPQYNVTAFSSQILMSGSDDLIHVVGVILFAAVNSKIINEMGVMKWPHL